MMDQIRTVVAGFLISIATLMSPIKQAPSNITPTIAIDKTQVTVTLAPRITNTPSIILTPTVNSATSKTSTTESRCEELKKRTYDYAKSIENDEAYARLAEQVFYEKCMRGSNGNESSLQKEVNQQMENTLLQTETRMNGIQNCQREMSAYSECIAGNAQSQQNYLDCLSGPSYSYCIKPFVNYCSKPICSY